MPGPRGQRRVLDTLPIYPYGINVSAWGVVRNQARRQMAHPFFTIGHSTRSIEEFVDLLASAKVRLLIDVRSIPRSRTNPQYNGDVLPTTLAGFEQSEAQARWRAELSDRRLTARSNISRFPPERPRNACVRRTSPVTAPSVYPHTWLRRPLRVLRPVSSPVCRKHRG